jgi:cytochrome c2
MPERMHLFSCICVPSPMKTFANLGILPLACMGLLSGCGQTAVAVHAKQIGNPSRGAALISWYGCGACHMVPGVAGANSLVGPPLTHFAQRGYVAGMLRNTPDNLVQWIRDPQKIVPGNAMPALGIDNRDAHDIAAYLYSID